MNNSFIFPELAVIYTALQERCERLEQLYSHDKSVKLKGEIEFTKSAIDKTKKIFLSIGGSAELLK